MIKKQLLFFAIFTFFLSSFCVAQKIKYKDLFYLLNAKKYDEAAPFLKSYLSNPKQADHPNANFQMGIIYHQKSKSKDVLVDTEDKIINIDSAIHFYGRAKILITEKEIKKRDEYYEEYYRRDLRTGKMGIKLSDVQLDVETRIAKLEEDRIHIIELKAFYVNANEFYSKSQGEYELLVKQFESQKQFLLRSDEKVVKQLTQIKSDYDSSMGNFGKYKIVLEELESPGYRQTLSAKNIEDIKLDGLTKSDFLKSTIEIWNYDEWVERTVAKINKEILPLHSKLIAFDNGINLLYKKVKEDSMSIDSDLENDEALTLEASVKAFDDDPFPFSLFSLKRAELEYLSSRLELYSLKGSINIDKQLKLTSKSLALIKNIDSVIVNRIIGYDIANEALNYKLLINENYGGESGLTAFVQEKKNLVSNVKEEMEKELQLLKEKSRWLISESDSIPLFSRDSSEVITLNKDKSYVHFGEMELNDTLRFAYGINYDFNGKPLMYFAQITDTHIVDLFFEFEIDAASFAIDSIAALAVTTVSDRGANSYLLVHSTDYNNKPTNGHLFRVKNDLTLSWEKPIALLYPPDVLTVSNDFGVVAINYNMEYLDKSNGLQLISREMYNMLTGELVKEKK